MDWKSLNLSAQQKQDLRKAMEQSRQRMLSILTEDQRKLLQQQEQSMKAQHQRPQPQTPSQAE
jgi:Spy/CpxP family protein refolding chaperone